MAKALLGGGFFVLESAVSGYALLGESIDAIPGALLMTVAGALPLACQAAVAIFQGGPDLDLNNEEA
jgi:hypothetical protein